MKLIIIVLLLFTTLFSFSQNDRIDEINKEIASAVENNNFELAHILKKEKELINQKTNAVNNSDYQLAAEIKKKLNDINRYLSIDSLLAEAVQNEDYQQANNLKEEKKELAEIIKSNWANSKNGNVTSNNSPNNATLNNKTEPSNDTKGATSSISNKKAYTLFYSTIHFGIRGLGSPGFWAVHYKNQLPIFNKTDAGIFFELSLDIGSSFTNSFLIAEQFGMGYKFEMDYFSPYASTVFGFDMTSVFDATTPNRFGFSSYFNLGFEILTLPLGRTAFGFYLESNLHLFRALSTTPDLLSLSAGFVIRSKTPKK